MGGVIIDGRPGTGLEAQRRTNAGDMTTTRDTPFYQPSYRQWCLPNREWQEAKLESLRYRFRGYRDAGGTQWFRRWMWRLGMLGAKPWQDRR